MSLHELFSALADPTRLKVLQMLHAKARPVHELASAFDISRPAISRHLRVLKDAGLVKELKQGRENVYSFERGALKAGVAWLERHQTKPAAKTKTKPKSAPAAVKAKLVPVPKAQPTVPKPVPAAIAAPSPAPQLSFFDL